MAVLVAKEILTDQISLFLEDDLMKTGDQDRIQITYQDYDVERIGATKPLTKRKYKNLVDGPKMQVKVLVRASRRMTLEFAESMNTQRDIIYKERNRLIKQEGRLM